MPTVVSTSISSRRNLKGLADNNESPFGSRFSEHVLACLVTYMLSPIEFRGLGLINVTLGEQKCE